MEITPIDPPISITPKPKVFDGMQISITMMVLNISATMRVYLFHSGDLVDTKMMTISGDDYQQWTNDDYLIQWVKNQLEAENI